jgi:hypothetical protein
VTIRVPALAAELGIEVCVVTSRRNWTKTNENWDDYAIRRIRQLARNYRVDNVVPFDVASTDAWISLQVTPPNTRVNG